MTNPVRNFESIDGYSNEVRLYWDVPIGFDATQQIIIARKKNQFPVELTNNSSTYTPRHNSGTTHVSGFTDYNQVEVFNGTVVYSAGSVSSSAATIVDAGASWTIDAYKGRLVRDSLSNNYKILSNTSNTLTLDTDDTPTIIDDVFVILPDYPGTDRDEFQSTSGDTTGNEVTDVSSEFRALNLKGGELQNMIINIAGEEHIIISNTTTTFVLDSAVSTNGVYSYTIRAKFGTLGVALPFIDNFKSTAEVSNQEGTGLEDEQYYHYTAFAKESNANIAEAVFYLYDDPQSTMVIGTSCKDRDGGIRLYDLWPGYNRDLDINDNLKYIMNVMDHSLNETRTHINLFRPYQSDKIRATATSLIPEQFGLNNLSPEVGIGAYRRLGTNLVSINKLKGTKEGLYELIRTITEWDITDGEGIDGIHEAIDDGNQILYTRFWSDIWPTNARMFGFQPAFDNDGAHTITYTSGTGIVEYSGSPNLSDVEVDYIFIGGDGGWYQVLDIPASNQIRISSGLTGITDLTPSGESGDILSKTPLENSTRFLKTDIGIVIPGLFSTRLVNIKVPNIALFEGESTSMTSTKLYDTSRSWTNDELIGNYILPKESEPTNIHKITDNGSNWVEINETFTNTADIGDYAILSPLNAQRLLQIYEIIKQYVPSFCVIVFDFENTL